MKPFKRMKVVFLGGLFDGFEKTSPKEKVQNHIYISYVNGLRPNFSKQLFEMDSTLFTALSQNLKTTIIVYSDAHTSALKLVIHTRSLRERVMTLFFWYNV